MTTRKRRNKQVDQRVGDATVQVNVPLGIVYIETTETPHPTRGTQRKVVIRVSKDSGNTVRSEGSASLTIVETDDNAPIATVEGKAQFIHDICNAVRDDLCRKLDKVPATWDGHELRELLADIFAAQRGNLMHDSRKRAYTKEVLVNNLDR